MSHHTKGDWCTGITSGDGGDTYEIATEVNGCIVSLATLHDGCYGMMGPEGEYANYTISEGEAKANAELMAAAQKLLAELMSLVRAIESQYEANGKESVIVRVARKRAAKLIDKITGGQQ